MQRKEGCDGPFPATTTTERWAPGVSREPSLTIVLRAAGWGIAPGQRLVKSSRARAALGSAAEPKQGRWAATQWLLDDHQPVSFWIAQPEQRRHRVAHTADLWVDVHAMGLQIGMVGINVIGL